ncbi:T6SS phospholipase effector Tle1-like catalytic domain-containing protein [Marinobacter sp. AL4B]|uniref:T6SS phospholipase effector Tle1-like catalytic domain-containing protein n=1 Tax=Marinobacter sp. AL4B TaxID=2871173 RepID=UPI001CAA7C81|nr:DUF2235 domain-containing protein [Marinobacter sp. AL4B]MBZ0332607.1 DUF2235 domain-containing protein [Marinobacter sp. AL4B]
MKIVSTWDLRAADLPGLESPFFAASKTKSLILDHAHNANNGELERLLGRSRDSPGGSRASRSYRAAMVEEVVRRIDDGELWLVHEVVDGEPSAPVVYWRSSDDGQAQWALDDGIANSEIRSSVDALNRHGITPQQLASQGIGGVGHLGANQFDAEYREKQQEEARQQRSTSENSNTSFPAQSVAPLALSAALNNEPETTKVPQEIHLEIGIFTDGTLNNAENSRELEERVAKECVQSFERGEISEEECQYWVGLASGGSYRNTPSNVAKLRDLYEESNSVDDTGLTWRFWVYAPGIGTKTGGGDSAVGAITGMGETGIISQVEDAFLQVARRIYAFGVSDGIASLTIDLFGFSRGAASARHAACEINRGAEGSLGRALMMKGIGWPERVVIRFVGLFDTVSAVINPAALDLSPSNDRNDPVNVYLDPGSVKHAVHLVAADEYRENFALNSLRNADGEIPKNFREIVLPGAHSDVGGGYPDSLREDLIISKYHKVDDDRTDRPDQTMQWDNLEELQGIKISEGWIGDFSLPVRSSEYHDPSPEELGPFGDASLEIYKIKSEHPTPRGRVELVLRMVRNIRGEYSRVALHLMRTLAAQTGVPFQHLGFDSPVGRLPNDLIAISREITGKVVAGEDKIQLRADQKNLIRQRYTHHSVNYDPLKFVLKDALFQLRLGRNFSPNAPVSSGERIIHRNL